MVQFQKVVHAEIVCGI